MVILILHGKHMFKSNMKIEEHGYSYLWFLIILVIFSVFISNNLLIYSTIKNRDNEDELFRIATIYCNALSSYYSNSPTGVMIYPNSMVDLLKDPRQKKDVRYLRALFLDPITGKEFKYIRNSQQKIVGFYSSSGKEILRKKLPMEFYYLNGSIKYSDLKFCLS